VSESESYIVDESDDDTEGGANEKMQTMDELLNEVTTPNTKEMGRGQKKRNPRETTNGGEGSEGGDKRMAERRKPAAGTSAGGTKKGAVNDPELVLKAIREVLGK